MLHLTKRDLLCSARLFNRLPDFCIQVIYFRLTQIFLYNHCVPDQGFFFYSIIYEIMHYSPEKY